MAQYYDKLGMDRFKGHSWTSIDVLAFLYGRKLDEASWGFIYSLRPSSVRVSTGEVTTDSREWRVTVIVDSHDTNIIQSISQEIRVYLPDGVPDAMGMNKIVREHRSWDKDENPLPEECKESGYFYCPYVP